MRKIDYNTAIELIEKSTLPIDDTREVDIYDALGRVIATDIRSPIDIPGYDRSPLDGYAVRSEDLQGSGIKSFTVIETVHAGYCPEKVPGKNEAVRIMTGAMMPKGSDCVVRFEDTVSTQVGFETEITLRPYQNYIFTGEDLKTGDLVFEKDSTLTAIHIGLLAGMGIVKVPIYRAPVVGVLSTGDEVVSYNSGPLPPGKIYDSNLTTITNRLRELGVEKVVSERCIDEMDALKSKLLQMSEVCDFIITIGGVSAGDADLVPDALSEIGAEECFWKVRIKPGSPIMYSLLGNLPILSLSGNPFASLTTFELLGRRILAIISRKEDLIMCETSALLVSDFPKKTGNTRYLRGLLKDGSVKLPEKHEAGIMSSMIGCNVLVEIPQGSPPIAAGTEVKCLII